MNPFRVIPEKVDEMHRQLDLVKTFLSDYAECVPQLVALFELVDGNEDWFEAAPGEDKLDVVIRKLQCLLKEDV